MRFEAMSPKARAAASNAASQFLLRHDYESLDVASQSEDLTQQELWDRIMDRAELPACDLPAFSVEAFD